MCKTDEWDSTYRRDKHQDCTQQQVSNLNIISSHLSFFQQLPHELCDKLFSLMTTRKFPKQSCGKAFASDVDFPLYLIMNQFLNVAAHENHSSGSLMVVVSGTFAVFSVSNAAAASAAAAAAAFTFSNSGSRKGSNDTYTEAMKLMKQSTSPDLGEYVCTLAPGDCFGALGFLEQAPRY